MKKPLLLIIAVYLSSCQQPSVESTPVGQPSYCATTVAEIAECTTSTNYPGGITVTGNARFFKRGLDLDHNGPNTGLTLGAKAPTALSVKYAEIRVLDGSGAVVQCGTTNASGALKGLDTVSPLVIPSALATNYTVQVLSRTHVSLPVPGGKPAVSLYTSVKKDICNNGLHSISGTLNSSSPSITLTAQAEESISPEINGGAFNILNDITTSYEYVANNTGTQDISCLNPKLSVFWKAGFNPGQYIYTTSDPSVVDNISFYLRGYNELYINGGKLGNVTSTDTDHFDDTVIIHELGHHIEDVCGKMDSPGGAHYGLFRIDPRLAWSEGWGNFFGAHILKNNLAAINPDISATLAASGGWLYYLDTAGYNDGPSVQTGSKLISLNLTKPGNSPEVYSSSQNLYYDKVDSSSNPGEGHFREVSVSRSLFKTTNTCSATPSVCTGQNYFSQMWQAFSNSTGMGSGSYPFRSSIRFYNRLKAVMGTMTDVDAILNTDEAQQRDGNSAYTVGGYKTWIPYGTKLVLSGVKSPSPSPCPLKIQPRQEFTDTTRQNSDQRYSSHFYYLDRASIQSVTEINMTATPVAGTSLDLDLILYQDGYHFPVESCLSTDISGNCTAYSKNTTSSEFIRSDRSTGLVKKLQNINSLNMSTPYLMNIKAFTAGKSSISSATEYSYTLTSQTGEFLCPASF